MQQKQNTFSRKVYSSNRALSAPKTLVANIFGDLWNFRSLIAILFLRDLKAQFRQSYFGYVWLVAPALMTTGVWLFLNQSNLIQVSDTGMPYPIFVLIGTIFWQHIANGITAPLNSFNSGKPVFMKINVPPEAFIVAGGARTIFDVLISLILLIPAFIAYNVTPAPTIILLPLVILAGYIMSSAIGILLIPIGSLYQDVGHAVNLTLRFAMFFAPVVYPIPKDGPLSLMMWWNPATPFLVTARDLTVVGSTSAWPAFLVWLLVSAITLVFSIVVLRIAMPHLVARMGM